MTRQSCASLSRPGGVSCRTNRKKRERIHFLSLCSNSFYSFCPLELSICIDAVGNPINEKKDGRCASVKSIVSRADIHDVFLIYFSLEQMCLTSDKKKDYHSVDDGHRLLVISSGTMNRTDSNV
jgi:hypothetical protein